MDRQPFRHRLRRIQNTFGSGTNDAFLVKFNSAGVRQGLTMEERQMISYGVIDASDNVYLAGRTSVLPVLLPEDFRIPLVDD